MYRHAGAAVAEVTWAVSAELTSELTWLAHELQVLAEDARSVSAQFASEVLAQVTWRASTVASTDLATERAFTEAPFQFQQRLRLDKLRHPTATPEVMRPRQHLPKSQIRRSEARCQGRLRLEAYT